MKIYGYVRVSTVKQSIKRQEDDIKKVYPDAIIVTDECTGKNLDRPGWTKLYKALKPGDTVVFDEVSRFSRDAEEGFQVYEELYNKGINLIFLKEPMINTENYRTSIRQQIDAVGDEIADTYIEATNKVLMILAKKQIKIAFERSQGEIVFHGQRTKEGINQARLNGKQIGQVYIKLHRSSFPVTLRPGSSWRPFSSVPAFSGRTAAGAPEAAHWRNGR